MNRFTWTVVWTKQESASCERVSQHCISHNCKNVTCMEGACKRTVKSCFFAPRGVEYNRKQGGV